MLSTRSGPVLILAAALALLAAGGASTGERRVALAIGNGAYEHARPLRMAVFTAAILFGLIVIRRVSEAYGLPALAPWGWRQ